MAWEHPDGVQATISELRALLRPFIVQLATKGLAIYPSDDLESGTDCEKLAENFELLAKGVLVDPHGGIFSQSALYEAFTQELAEYKVKMKIVQASAFSAGKFGHEIVWHLVHKIRVMFAHVRSGKLPTNFGIDDNEPNDDKKRLRKLMTTCKTNRPDRSRSRGHGGSPLSLIHI